MAFSLFEKFSSITVIHKTLILSIVKIYRIVTFVKIQTTPKISFKTVGELKHKLTMTIIHRMHSISKRESSPVRMNITTRMIIS